MSKEKWRTCKAGFVQIRGCAQAQKRTREKQFNSQEGEKKTAFRHDHGQHCGSLAFSDWAPANRPDAEVSSTGVGNWPVGCAAMELTSPTTGKKLATSIQTCQIQICKVH